MARVKGGNHTYRRQKYAKMAKGYVGGRRRLYRTMRETVQRALVYAYRDRKVRKREFRALWIIRINAALQGTGLNYSRFIQGLKRASIEVDRKNLSQLAHYYPEAFTAVVEKAKAALPVAV